MGGRSFRSGVGRAAPIGLRHVVRHKGRIVAVDGAGRIKKHGPQVLLDVADFGGVIPQAVHDELDVMAAQFQELGLDQLCWVIVPGHPDGLAVGADGFQQDVHDLVQLLPVYPGILGEGVILDILQNQVPVDLIGRFLSVFRPFRRRCRCLVLVRRQGVWGMDRKGIGI